jgi:hypothetical protein
MPLFYIISSGQANICAACPLDTFDFSLRNLILLMDTLMLVLGQLFFERRVAGGKLNLFGSIRVGQFNQSGMFYGFRWCKEIG